jgi:hypothetical protein
VLIRRITGNSQLIYKMTDTNYKTKRKNKYIIKYMGKNREQHKTPY